MMRTLVPTLIVIGLVGTLTWLLNFKETRVADEIITLDDPLWYRTLEPSERLNSARIRLDLMTSNTPDAKDIGPIKDEIALLCRDEAVVDMVVSSFRERREWSLAQMSAYLEIFARVRNKKFATLVKSALSETRIEARINAFDAAVTQKDPDLVDYIALEIPRSDAYQVQRAITALARIGTEASWNEIRKLIHHGDARIAEQCAILVGQGKMSAAVPDLLRGLEGAEPRRRLILGTSLVELGQSKGEIILQELASDKSVAAELRAQAIHNLTRLGRTTSAHRQQWLNSESAMVRFEAELGELATGNESIWTDIRKRIADTRPETRRVAWSLLGRLGHVELAVLNKQKLDEDEWRFYMQGISISQPKEAVPLLEELARENNSLAVAALQTLCNLGTHGLEALGRMFHQDLPAERFRDLVYGIGGFKTPRALEILESMQGLNDRHRWRLVRDMIRLLEQDLLKS